MGTNNIPTATPGTTIPSSDHNSLKDALEGDLVPRNTSGNPADVSGSIGSTLYRWANAFLNKITLGLIASGLTIEEDTGDMVFKANSSEIMRITPTQVTGTFDPNLFNSLQQIVYTSSSTFTVPANVTTIIIEGCGGGNGGNSNSSGTPADGGRGAPYGIVTRNVSPGQNFNVTIGSGGAGGTGSGSGGPGQDSTFDFGIPPFGARFRGANASTPVIVGAANGGIGGANGDSNVHHSGGFGNSNKGGGGAGPFGDGGAGNNSGIGFSAGSNTGAGGGAGLSSSGGGGAGGSGKIIISWVGQ